MRTKKQKVFLFLKITLLLVILGVSVAFAFRNSILESAIARIDHKLNRDYQCRFHVKNAQFYGLSNLEFDEISLVPQKADTLVSIKNLKTSVNVWELLFGNIQLGKLEINKGFIQLVKNEKGRNFDAFLKRKKEEKNDDQQVNYAKLAYRILSKTLNLVPTDMNVKGFAFKMDDMGNKVVFDFVQLQLEDKKLHSIIKVKEDNLTQNWSISGFADPRDRKADLKFFNTKNDRIRQRRITLGRKSCDSYARHSGEVGRHLREFRDKGTGAKSIASDTQIAPAFLPANRSISVGIYGCPEIQRAVTRVTMCNSRNPRR